MEIVLQSIVLLIIFHVFLIKTNYNSSNSTGIYTYKEIFEHEREMNTITI